MGLYETLLGIFTDEDTQESYQNDPEGYLNQNGFGNVSSQDIQAEMPRVFEAIQGNTGGATQGGAASFASSGNVVLPPPPPPAGGGGGGAGGGEVGDLQEAIETINHYTSVVNVTEQTIEDNDLTTIDDRDTAVDQSVNQDITAFGDIDQNFDNDVVSGDGAVAAGDGSTVNTGDGAVQAGDDISDSTIATGNVSGTVTGDVSDSVVGEGNQVIQDSEVGAATFGSGDATNVEAANANLGDGNIIDDTSGDVALNQGDGTQIVDSDLDESVVGSGSVESDDVSITADDGSAVAFGDGDANAEEQNVNIEDNVGTVQVAGDQSSQTGLTDQSTNENFDADNSFNTAIEETDNSINGSFDTENSFNPDNSLTDESVTDQSDDDVIDMA
jgi:hypothetical protein